MKEMIVIHGVILILLLSKALHSLLSSSLDIPNLTNVSLVKQYVFRNVKDKRVSSNSVPSSSCLDINAALEKYVK